MAGIAINISGYKYTQILSFNNVLPVRFKFYWVKYCPSVPYMHFCILLEKHRNS